MNFKSFESWNKHGLQDIIWGILKANLRCKILNLPAPEQGKITQQNMYLDSVC